MSFEKRIDSETFAASLAAEVRRILADPSFERSPVQSKLLEFLAEKTASGESAISQYSVAVDGLGRSADYDLTSDSYPRVQVSRLRTNLAAYYSRHRAANGLCVYIKAGEYRLRLAKQAIAYPGTEGGMALSGERADPVPAAIMHEGRQAPEPARPARPARTKRVTPSILAGALALSAVAAALLLWQFLIPQPTTMVDEGAPIISLAVTSEGVFDTDEPLQQLSAKIERMAQTRLSQSFVSNSAPSSEDQRRDEDYSLVIDMGVDMDTPNVKITLFSDDYSVLFSKTVAARGDTDDVLQQISSNLVYIISPTGIVAQEEARAIGKRPETPYQCFISIEVDRGLGAETEAKVDNCLQRFPDNRYRAFWYARKAFAGYQKRVGTNQLITASGAEWDFVERALMQDPHNAFANFVAAKVSLAENQCESARIYTQRALEKGISYPAMLANAEAEGSGCSGEGDLQKVVSALVANNPAPDPILQLYLVFASLSIDRKDLALTASNRPVIQQSEGAIEAASLQLRNAVNDPVFYASNKSDVDRTIQLFIWNTEARRKIRRSLG
ncbi:hypothetical protein [Pontixanthobacter sp.]|uniref:hypothetical protein n=1 Tax=Pontixanthobacter sp. TaxID=2792078 RepID=UPI003C7C985C